MAESQVAASPIGTRQATNYLGRRRALRYWLLLVPGFLLLGTVFLYPIARFLLLSFQSESGISLANYRHLLTVPLYSQVLINTGVIALSTTVLCLVLGYPLAYFIANLSSVWSRRLLFLVLIPFWISILVRSYAWMVLLGRNGIVNNFLSSIGVISEPLPLMFNRTGVLIGMVQILLPYMILPLFAVMRSIDPVYLRAAASLGAPGWRAMLHVYFPLSLPGVAAGSLLVFILSLGFFITPALLGGRRDMMIAMLIEQQVNQALNFGLAAALAGVLLVATIVLLVVFERVLGLERLLGGLGGDAR